jgi:hypothetical protein
VSEETVALADERDANRGWQVVAVTERSTA